jgi:regulator of PEP synthase PpsR (kinase-PPPase family)
MDGTDTFHLHLISDSTGETLDALARAALAPFAETSAVRIHLSVLVRSARDLETVLAGVREQPGQVWYTVVDPALRDQITATCDDLGVDCIGVLDPLIAALGHSLGRPPSHRPGMQHRMTPDHFDRVAALDYAIAHDDGAHDSGQLEQRLRQADVILTGISRTSKTPTCIYLAYRAVKAANVPLVPGAAPPPALLAALAAGVPVIGLTASPFRLAQVRAQRLESLGRPDLGQTGAVGYADLDRIRSEVADARLFFQRYRIPVIDVTRRSIEETAAEILAELGARRGAAGAERPALAGGQEPR